MKHFWEFTEEQPRLSCIWKCCTLRSSHLNNYFEKNLLINLSQPLDNLHTLDKLNFSLTSSPLQVIFKKSFLKILHRKASALEFLFDKRDPILVIIQYLLWSTSYNTFYGTPFMWLRLNVWQITPLWRICVLWTISILLTFLVIKWQDAPQRRQLLMLSQSGSTQILSESLNKFYYTIICLSISFLPAFCWKKAMNKTLHERSRSLLVAKSSIKWLLLESLIDKFHCYL